MAGGLEMARVALYPCRVCGVRRTFSRGEPVGESKYGDWRIWCDVCGTAAVVKSGVAGHLPAMIEPASSPAGSGDGRRPRRVREVGPGPAWPGDGGGMEWRVAPSAAGIPAYNPAEAGTDAGLDGLEETSWLWRHWVPMGCITMVGGKPKVGKSTFAHHLAYRAVLGGRWPDNQVVEGWGGSVLWIEAEGAFQEWRDRRVAWGVKPGVIRFLYGDPVRKVWLDDEGTMGHLRAFCRYHHPRLIVVDSLEMAHRRDSREARQMKALLEDLRAVAQEFGLAVVLVMHMRKRFGDQSEWGELSIEEISGTSLFLYEARSIILFDYAGKWDLWHSGTPRVRVAASNWRGRPELVQRWEPGGLSFGALDGHEVIPLEETVRALLLERGVVSREEVEEAAGCGPKTARRLLRAVGAHFVRGKGWMLAGGERLL